MNGSITRKKLDRPGIFLSGQGDAAVFRVLNFFALGPDLPGSSPHPLVSSLTLVPFSSGSLEPAETRQHAQGLDPVRLPELHRGRAVVA